VRGAVAQVDITPWAPGLVGIAALVGGWMVARSLGIAGAEHLAVVLLIPVSIATLLGTAVVRAALFPLLFLVAAVPVGDSVVPYLVESTATLSSTLLRAVGVPVFRDGAFLTLPGGNFEVAETCAGLRYLISGMMVALLFAYLTYQSNLKRAIFVAAVGITVVLANGVRAFIVMYVASATDMRYLAGRDHVVFGWLLFGAVLIAALWIGSGYADFDERGKDAAAGRNAPHRARFVPLILLLCLTMLAITAVQFRASLSGSWFLLWPAGLLLIWFLYRRFEGPTASGAANGRAFSAYTTPRAAVIIALAVLAVALGPLWASQTDTLQPVTLSSESN
jgi:exosortase